MPQLAYKEVHQDIPAQSFNPYTELGETLTKAREESRLSRWDVASFLHVEPWVVEALESGDFQKLSAPVYVKGYLRNYARVVKLAAEPLIERYNQTIGYEPAPVVVPSQESDSVVKPPRPWRRYLLLVALVLVPIFWVSQQTVPGVGSSSKLESGSAPGPALASETSKEIPLTVADEQAKRSQALAPAREENSANSPPTASVAAPAPDGLDRIKVQVRADAWLSIQDQSGQRVAYEKLASGAEREYAGHAPFRVVLGNSAVTRIELNGQPFDHSKYAVGSTARFNMGQPSQRVQTAEVSQAEPPSGIAASDKPAGGLSGPDQIKVSVADEAWVSIRDQVGQRIAYETLPRGAERVFSGAAPFSVVLGNSPATKIELNGKPFDHSRFNRGTSARFKLPK